ncbi:MAG: hypothetical protein VZR09_08375 [Candidatus Gastranaerophilaceae bacterium]|nr:hypothetical protein [Candidatus Gastranaerophilaceae bacterium]
MNTVNELLKAYNFDTNLFVDDFTLNHQFVSGMKKWIGEIVPCELLSRNVKNAVESLDTLSQDGIFYDTFPDVIESPDYGDNWGVSANYIEINNRAIAEMSGNLCRKGLISTIKLLPAIPPSAKSWANCIILSQIFPNIYGDGFNKSAAEENSIYGIKLNTHYSENIIDTDISDKLPPELQFRAFNDLANFHGLKTGFRTVISADQIKVVQPDGSDVTFDWKNEEHFELFLNAHIALINTGFEAIFIDSAKHIGGYDMGNYTGVGALPSYEQMQYIIHEIRSKTGNTHLSFVGEKSTGDFERYENLGLSTGTGFIEPDDFHTVRDEAIDYKYSKNYSPGVEVSNDNDTGGRSYEERLHRINNSLFAYEFPSDKLASFMQMEDMFPLRYDTNTHHLMMSNPSYSTDGTPESHWENLFAKNDGRDYNKKVSELFVHSLNL